MVETGNDEDFSALALLEEQMDGIGDEDPNFKVEDYSSAYPGFEDDMTNPEDMDQEYTERDAFDGCVEASPKDDVTAREGDLALDDILEENREAIEGSLELKRALSKDMGAEESALKRRRLSSGFVKLPELKNKIADLLIMRWRLQRDSATNYVLRMASDAMVEKLSRTGWVPTGTNRTPAEQIYEKLTKLEESEGPPGGPLDAVVSFGYRWRLTKEEDGLLANLTYKGLKFVMDEYDKSRPVKDLAEEGEGNFAEPDMPCPEKPGIFTMGRSNCLELIDPFGDALVLGDANLTFSVQLAEHRKSLHHIGRTVATTFEKLETLQERYQEIPETVQHLETLECEVLHNVDCTRLAAAPRLQGMEEKIGAVYYNFPHAGVVPGFFDGHPFVRWRHANLMHLFFRALRTFVKPGGSVKVASNSGATGVRYSDIIQGGANSEFIHVETFPFLEWSLSRYRRSYGDRRDSHKRPEDGDVYASQRAQSDMVYCFIYKPSGNPPPPPQISFPPSREELVASNEGRAGRLPPPGVARAKRVEELWQLFLSYCDGIHVG